MKQPHFTVLVKGWNLKPTSAPQVNTWIRYLLKAKQTTLHIGKPLETKTILNHVFFISARECLTIDVLPTVNYCFNLHTIMAYTLSAKSFRWPHSAHSFSQATMPPSHWCK